MPKFCTRIDCFLETHITWGHNGWLSLLRFVHLCLLKLLKL